MEKEFKSLDHNNDGFVTKAEVFQVVLRMTDDISLGDVQEVLMY